MERRWPDRDTTGKWKRGRAGRLDEALMEEGGGAMSKCGCHRTPETQLRARDP